MAITLNVGGVPVTVSTAAEAAELLRAIGATGQPRPIAPVSAANGHTVVRSPVNPPPKSPSSSDPANMELALRFLRMIEAHPKGVATQGIMEALRVSVPKAIGSRAAVINGLLESEGFKPKHVYRNPRQREGGRTWLPARLMGSAIEAVEKRLSASSKERNR